MRRSTRFSSISRPTKRTSSGPSAGGASSSADNPTPLGTTSSRGSVSAPIARAVNGETATTRSPSPARAGLEPARHARHDRPIGQVLGPVRAPVFVPGGDEPRTGHSCGEGGRVERQIGRRRAVDDVVPMPEQERSTRAEKATASARCACRQPRRGRARVPRRRITPSRSTAVLTPPADEVDLVPVRQPLGRAGHATLRPAGRPRRHGVVDERDPHQRGSTATTRNLASPRLRANDDQGLRQGHIERPSIATAFVVHAPKRRTR